MKKGDKVYVNWPTGKGGQYKIVESDNVKTTQWQVPISVDGYVCWIHKNMICDVIPAELEISEGRVAYVWKGNSQIIAKYNPYIHKLVRPVHRRWYELTTNEQEKFTHNVTGTTGGYKYKIAYKYITGEEHP